MNFLFTNHLVPMHFCSIHSCNGKLIRVLEPGRYRFFGNGHRFQLFDMRTQWLAMQTQELIALDGITVKATAVGAYRILDPVVLGAATGDPANTLYMLMQLALRDVISGVEAETLLANARTLGPQLLAAIQTKTSELGVEFTELVLRDLILPSDIKNAMSEGWRAKKSALAEIETARGKAAAARTMANASRLYENHPALLKIRYLEALEQASSHSGNTFVIGLPDTKTLNLL